MKAAVIVKADAGNQLRIENVQDPVAAPNQLLVRVRSIGLNRADLGLKIPPNKGASATPPAAIPGMEMAGEVIEVGPEVRNFKVGDRVMAMASRSYAELVVVDARLAMKVPSSYTWEEAAGTPLAMMTAHDALVTNGRLQRGESVLIQAATSGVGLATLQIAKHKGAKLVIGTSTNDEKLKRLMDLGLDVPVNAKQGSVLERVREATSGSGVDVVIDHIGAQVLADSMKALAVRGRLVQVGRLGGSMANEVDLDLLALNRIHLIGVTFRTRSPDEVAALVKAMVTDIGTAMEALKFRPVIDRVFPLDAVAEAHRHMKSNAHFGKLILNT